MRRSDKTAAARNTLALPPAPKLFLVSPPGSPPVGWTQSFERPNNIVSQDIIDALGNIQGDGEVDAADEPEDDERGIEPKSPQKLPPRVDTSITKERRPTKVTVFTSPTQELPSITVESFEDLFT